MQWNLSKQGFWQIDEALDGLKRGEVYFISALEHDVARGFAASLCATVDSLSVHRPIFITDFPVPYCRCEHIHFANIDELIEFFRVILDGDKTYEPPKTDLYVFEDYDFFHGIIQSLAQEHIFTSAFIRGLSISIPWLREEIIKSVKRNKYIMKE